MISDIKKVLKKNDVITISYDRIMQFYYRYLISDEKLIKTRFKKRMSRDVDLENPVKYNDKLQWLKLNWYDPTATKCADKYEVREFVSERIGEQYLNELLAVYESVDEIDIDALPKSFVLKGTHGSGFNLICKDKNKVNWNEEFKHMRRWLKKNYYLQNREWVYKDIKPRIICEKYLTDSSMNPPMDYKIFCFHGQPKLIQVDIDRFGGHKQNFYDTEWKFKDVEIWCDNDKDINIQKPINFDEMLTLSQKLSKSFPHVRVDFYNVDGKIVFGELTFFHMSGMSKFRNNSLELEMGDSINLYTIHEDGVYTDE